MQDEENEDSIGEEAAVEIDMEDESMSDDVDSDDNPWEKLIKEVMNDMNSDWEEQLTIHMYQGASRERAEAERFNALLPAFQKIGCLRLHVATAFVLLYETEG